MNGNMQKYSLGKKMIAFLLAITLCFQLAGMESLTLEAEGRQFRYTSGMAESPHIDIWACRGGRQLSGQLLFRH